MDSDDPGVTEPPTLDEKIAAQRGTGARLGNDRYRLGEKIGQGGMGEVVVARDEQLGRDVAIKRIRSGEPSDRAVRRFLREARIQGRLEHPAIPPVHELGRDANGLPFFAMKKLTGRTLSSFFKDPDTAQPKRMLRAFADVCLAVEFAHVNGVIHRDLKPDNIVLGDFGEVYVIDWGVAKVVGEAEEEFDDIRSDQPVTRAGTAVGTPGYMAPEQERGDVDIDERVDVYALGCVLDRILQDEPHAIPELERLCTQAMAAVREERLKTARQLGEAVQRYLDGDRDVEQRRRLAGEQLERARGAFAADDRATAMREAGRALALDPEHAGAGELIGRLMIEPPATTPPEVEAELHADQVSRLRLRIRYSWTFLGYLLLVPGLIQTGSLGLAVACLAMIALAVVVAVTATYREWLPAWTLAAANAPILMVIGHMYSPLLVAPGLAAVLAMTIAGHPMVERVRDCAVIFGVLFAAFALPVIGEAAGIVPASYVSTDQGILITAVAVPFHAFYNLWLVVYVGVMIAISLFVPYAMRAPENELRRKLFVQSWQLRQLVPSR